MVAGATLPPVAVCIRTLWSQIGGARRDTAFALEAALQELVFVVGPVLVAVSTLVASAAAATLATAAFGLTGTVAFATTPAARVARPDPASTTRGRACASILTPGLRTLLVGSGAMGVVFGVLEVAMPAFAEDHGPRSAGAFALAAASAGSLLGGLYAGARPAACLTRRYQLGLAALTIALVPLLVAPSIPAMVALAFVLGIPIAPMFASAYGLLDDLAPAARVTEAFAWNSSVIVAGASSGTALAGVVVGRGGVDAAVALAIVAAALGTAAAVMRGATLSRA